MHDLPVIDVAALASPELADRRAVAAALGAAARGPGFLYVTGHGIPAALLDAAFAGARAFFALPAQAKLALDIRHSPHHRG